MTFRRIIALTALVSGLVALYLHLWKLGLMGTLSCGVAHGCEYVQGSRYGWFLGVDVALIGTVGYTMVMVTALVGSDPRLEDARWPTLALMGMIYPAFLFTLRLKYAEFIILHGFCPWCLVSALTITLHTVLVTLDWKRVRRLEAEGAA